MKKRVICRILECEHFNHNCYYCRKFKTYVKQGSYPDCEKIREYLNQKEKAILVYRDFVDEVLQERL